VLERVRKEHESRWLPDRIPDGWPPFDIEKCDACSGGVRQLAQHCCILHDGDYWYGRHWWDKIAADLRLMVCIWRRGWAKVRQEADPDPLTAYPAWIMLGIGRFIGVLLFGWGAFYRKEHKRNRRSGN
jgi:hypothetical protein